GNISLWDKNWLSDGASIQKPVGLDPMLDYLTVADLMMKNEKTWDYNMLHGIGVCIRDDQCRRLKCNVDASFSSSRNKVGIGVCIRDDQGRFVLAKTEWYSPLLDVDVGESMGLLSAVTWVKELHLNSVVFELDSKHVVDSFNRNELD
ncbi:cytochrome P450, partial [Trifolium medium]|nr:cytochrome P450 [Trifolium medium]